MTMQLFRYAERPDLWKDTSTITRGVWPEYNIHADDPDGHWERLLDRALARRLSPASHRRGDRLYAPGRPGIQLVPASGTRAIAAASIVSATRSSGSRLCTCDLPQARASVWVSSTKVRR